MRYSLSGLGVKMRTLKHHREIADENIKETYIINHELQRFAGLTKEEKEKEDDGWNIQIKELNDLLLILKD